LREAFEADKENFTRMINYEINNIEVKEEFRELDI
jgi:hypothetical protein